MGIPYFLEELRKKIGHDLIVMPAASVTLFDETGRILLAMHADRNIWVLPGGIIEPGESPADAAVREVWEETGLLIELTSVFGVFGGMDFVVTYANGDRVAYVATIFRGTLRAARCSPTATKSPNSASFPGTRLALSHTPSGWIGYSVPCSIPPLRPSSSTRPGIPTGCRRN